MGLGGAPTNLATPRGARLGLVPVLKTSRWDSLATQCRPEWVPKTRKTDTPAGSGTPLHPPAPPGRNCRTGARPGTAARSREQLPGDLRETHIADDRCPGWRCRAASTRG